MSNYPHPPKQENTLYNHGSYGISEETLESFGTLQLLFAFFLLLNLIPGFLFDKDGKLPAWFRIERIYWDHTISNQVKNTPFLETVFNLSVRGRSCKP